MIDAVQRLADHARRDGADVSTSEVVDAVRALSFIELTDRELVRVCLRAVMVHRETDLAVFDRAFDRVFGARDGADPRVTAEWPGAGAAPSATGAVAPDASALAAELNAAARAGDTDAMAALATRAVDALGDASAAGRVVVHRILRALDVSNLLAAAMRDARACDLPPLELALRRHEVAAALEAFRRALAAEVERRRAELFPEAPTPSSLADRPVLSLTRVELEELRRTIAPLARQLAARISRRRRPGTTGRADIRRTIRRSLQSGGIPIDVELRRRHPHRARVVLLCDVSGSVAEFARFTFLLVHAVHEALADVRSFAFVGGVTETTAVFAEASHEVPVTRLLEGPDAFDRADTGRRVGAAGLDGHSDYGAAFGEFVERYLDDAVCSRTTVIVTGDARTNFRDPGVTAFRSIAERSRRTYWLDPDPRGQWDVDDSEISRFAPWCDGLYEVATARALSGVVAELL